MALNIHLKSGAQVIINGAVLENVSGRTISLALQNEAAVLRGDDILTPDAAVTPASRVYYALQCLYLFADRTPEQVRELCDLLSNFVTAVPSAEPIARDVLAALDAGNFYAALKKAQSLIHHEAKVLNHVHDRLVKALQQEAGAG
jgi:flagellar biosynthesis repressor protein FlbT